MRTDGHVKEYTADHLLATWGNMLIAVWRVTTIAGVQAAQRVYEGHVHEHPEGVLLLTVVEEQAPLPDSSVRTELGHLLDRGAGKTKMSAVVFEGSGFRAAAVRSVVTGLSLFANTPYPHKVFATVDDAMRFFEPRSDVSWKILIGAVRAVRDRYETNLRQLQ